MIWKIYFHNFSGSVFICWPQHLPEHKSQHLADDKCHASEVGTVLCQPQHPSPGRFGSHGEESVPSFLLEEQAQVSARVRNQAQDKRRGHLVPSGHRDKAEFSPQEQQHCSVSQTQRDETKFGMRRKIPNTAGRETHSTQISATPSMRTLRLPQHPTLPHQHIPAQERSWEKMGAKLMS